MAITRLILATIILFISGILLLLPILVTAEEVETVGPPQPRLTYSIRVYGISTDGIMIPPTPTPTSIPPTVEVKAVGRTVYSCPLPGGDWGYIIDDYDWNLDEACSVIDCESDGYVYATSHTGCKGLFQICPNGSYEPETNVSQAWGKYQYGLSYGNRWGEWNRFGSCGHYY